ncbi:MAG: arylsulfatase, partial [Fuerstiella sp.]|nr:arylsulfatase [Fuerstiella sp.]
LQGVRSGRWKLMFPQTYNSPIPGSSGLPGKADRHELELSLFDLYADVSEVTNVAEKHPEIVRRLQQLASDMREDLGDGRTNVGTGRRPLALSN